VQTALWICLALLLFGALVCWRFAPETRGARLAAA
jgi:hypothetical protein